MNEYVISTETLQYGQGRIVIEILPDEDPSRPDEFGGSEPEFFSADRGDELRRKLTSEFGQREGRAYETMAGGGIYKDAEGNWYFGITEYRHGGSAMRLCGDWRASCWPDQQWDVIKLSGWVKISKELRQDWGIHGKRGVEDKARANAEGTVKVWESYINGRCCGFQVSQYTEEDEDEPVEEESCWGFYFEQDALDDARDRAKWMADEAGWTIQEEEAA